MQKNFGNPINPVGLLESAVILRLHWQYYVKRFGVRRSYLCCKRSTNPAPQLHSVDSTLSYILCVITYTEVVTWDCY